MNKISRWLAGSLAAVCAFVAGANIGTMSMMILHEPEVPEELK